MACNTKIGRALRDYKYRAVVGAKGKGLLIGGTPRHASSWFDTKREADDWAWAIHEGNQGKVAYVTIERRRRDGVVETVPWAYAGEVEI